MIAELSGQKPARNTIRLAVASLRGLLTSAVEDGLLSVNPARRGRPVRSRNTSRRLWNQREAQRFLDAALEYCQDYYPLFLIALRAGLRQGEILDLKWGDIQFGKDESDPNRFLVVQRRWYRGTFSSPKGREDSTCGHVTRAAKQAFERARQPDASSIRSGQREYC